MLPILLANPNALTRHTLQLVIPIALLGCGKTPDGAALGAAGNTGDSTTTAGTSNNTGSTGNIPPSCKGSAQPGDMVSVPESTFQMGCNAAVDAECKDDEKPLHAVALSAFEVDRNEVSQEDYVACVEGKSCTPPSCTYDCTVPGMPAGCVTWEQARSYCTFAGKHLPTEAQWEKAARGSDGRKFPWGNEAADCNRVNMAGCGGPDPVGSHPAGASPYGALDMAGNMVEMIADWYEASYYNSSPSNNPTGPAKGERYGGRGGGFKSEEPWQRVSARDWYDLTDEGLSLGFRCAR